MIHRFHGIFENFYQVVSSGVLMNANHVPSSSTRDGIRPRKTLIFSVPKIARRIRTKREKNPVTAKREKKMSSRKRQRLDESSDGDEIEEKKFNNEDLLRLLESGEPCEYLPLPVNYNLLDCTGLSVEFEEITHDDKRLGYVRCKTPNCLSKKESKYLFGHFKPHAIDNVKNRVRPYKKALLERHITRWHTEKGPSSSQSKNKSSGYQPKLGSKYGFQTQLSQSFKKTYKKETMNFLAKKGLPLNFCEDDHFKVRLSL